MVAGVCVLANHLSEAGGILVPTHEFEFHDRRILVRVFSEEMMLIGRRVRQRSKRVHTDHGQILRPGFFQSIHDLVHKLRPKVGFDFFHRRFF